MGIGLDGRIIEERRATPIGNTGSVPEGTMLTVPAAPPRGGTGPDHPIVAVNTTSKWADPVFLLQLISGLTAISTAVIDVIPANGPIDWRATTPNIVMAILNGAGAFLRTQLNSVTK